MQKYRDNVLESITSGRRERKLMQASAAVWKSQRRELRRVQAGRRRQKGSGKVPGMVTGRQGTWQQMQDAAKAATGTLEKIRAALNVQLAAAGKPTI
jgi:hypothetical protein